MSEVRRRRLDRATWANYSSLSYDVELFGVGEGVIEVDFGRAFSAPPTLSYSAVFDAIGDDVLPQIYVPPKGAGSIDVDSYGLGNNSMMINPSMQDPSFEQQGQYISLFGDGAREIPDVHIERDEGTFGIHQIAKLWNDASYPEGTFADPFDGGEFRGPLQSGWESNTNYWVQTDEAKERWVVSDEKSDVFGVGADGSYSAKYVFGSSPTSSALIPVDNWMGGYWLMDPDGDRRYDRFMWYTALQSAAIRSYPSTNSYGVLGYTYQAVPPYPGGWVGYASAWSDGDCTLEITATNWHGDGGAVDDGVDELFYLNGNPVTDDYVYGGSADNANLRILNHDVVSLEVKAGSWNQFNVDLSNGGNRVILNWPPLGDNKSDIASAYTRLEYRIKGGSPGQVVYLDNLLMSQRLTNNVIPILTVGVAEWAIDDGGAYVGAKVWFKSGMPT